MENFTYYILDRYNGKYLTGDMLARLGVSKEVILDGVSHSNLNKIRVPELLVEVYLNELSI